MMTKMGKDHCPHCGAMLDHATSLEGAFNPKPGDFSVCIKCGGFNKYGDDFALEKLPHIIFETLDTGTQRQLMKARVIIKTKNLLQTF